MRDDGFLEGAAWHEGKHRYESFVERALEDAGRVLFLELGVGGMTPSVIEIPFWRMVRANPGAFYLRINLGKADGFYPNTLIDMINRNVPGRVAIGKIDILPDFARFEIEEKESHRTLAMLKNLNFFGKRVQVSLDSATGKDEQENVEKTRIHRKKSEHEPSRPRRKGYAFDERKGKSNNYSGKKAHKNK